MYFLRLERGTRPPTISHMTGERVRKVVWCQLTTNILLKHLHESKKANTAQKLGPKCC